MKYYLVTFKDGRQATFSQFVIDMMMYDNDVIEIIDKETGEIIK